MNGTVILFGLMAILFNPIIPVYLYDRDIWVPIDIIGAIVFVINGFVFKNTGIKTYINALVLVIFLLAGCKSSREQEVDTAEFYEGTYECCLLYDIFKKDIDYALSLLETERERCPKNYQIRLLLMKLHLFEDNLERVIEIGNELHHELPDLSNDVSFNSWREEAMDSLKIKDRKSYEEIIRMFQ